MQEACSKQEIGHETKVILAFFFIAAKSPEKRQENKRHHSILI